MRLLLFLFFLFLFFSFPKAQTINTLFINEGFTQTQFRQIEIFSEKALNLLLNAYTIANSPRVSYRKIKENLEGSLFFTAQAKQFSPSYVVKKKIELTVKQFSVLPKEKLIKAIDSTILDIKDIAGGITEYQEVINSLQSVKSDIESGEKDKALEKLKELKDKVKFPLIDEPLENTQMLIMVALDNMKAGNYKYVKDSIKLAIQPLSSLVFGDNLYLALFKEYIYKAYQYYKNDKLASKLYIDFAKRTLQKALLVADEEDKELIEGLIHQLDFVLLNFDKEPIVLKEFIIIIRQVKNL